MTEIQRLLTETIDDLNIREKCDNKPRFSISFIRRYSRLSIDAYVAWFATLVVMLQSETLIDLVQLLVVLSIVLNGFFFPDVVPRYRFEDTGVPDFRVCYNGEWYNTRFVPPLLINAILYSPSTDSEHKTQLQKMISRKGELLFYDVSTPTRAQNSKQRHLSTDKKGAFLRRQRTLTPEMLAKKLTPFFTTLYCPKARIRFANNVQTPFAFYCLAVGTTLFCAAR